MVTHHSHPQHVQVTRTVSTPVHHQTLVHTTSQPQLISTQTVTTHQQPQIIQTLHHPMQVNLPVFNYFFK
jgi:hypothetical protein